LRISRRKAKTQSLPQEKTSSVSDQSSLGANLTCLLGELQEKYIIHDMKLFKSSAVVMSIVILMFFLHSVIHVSMVWIAIIGFMVHLVVAEVERIEEALEKVGEKPNAIDI